MLINRKGAISLGVLLFATIAMVIVIWWSFYNSDAKFNERATQLSNTIGEIDFSQKYISNEAALIVKQTIDTNGGQNELKSKFKEIAAAHYQGIEVEGNLFGKIRNDEFNFAKDNAGYVLQIKGIGIGAKNDVIELKRSFDIELKFDKNGERLA